MAWFTLNDKAAGRSSRSAFVAMTAFWCCAIKFVFSGAHISLFGHSTTINFGHVDAALLGAFLVPCLGLYWGRRFTDSKSFPTPAGIEAISAANPSPCPPGAPGPQGPMG